jgi:hypothetical protein
MPAHVVLLGDSIFDNARYVPGFPAVIEQVRRGLPAGWRASLLAVDGHVTRDVLTQLARLPGDASHLVISTGGNDALAESALLHEPVPNVGEALRLLHQAQRRFDSDYREMLGRVLELGKPTAVCTVYDAIPGLQPQARTALAAFNDVILRCAVAAHLPVIDLRLACTQPGDYSPLSPIEPSVSGGAKIARLVVQVACSHDFSGPRTVIYT